MIRLALICIFALLAAADAAEKLPALQVSENHRYLVESATGRPVFLLADTAWNLGALDDEEIDLYLENRAQHGFNVIMFALNFAPQADEKNAHGHAAYVGTDKTELNPDYFKDCDAIVSKCAERGMYVMLYAMWAGEKSGTMNFYTPAQLHLIGLRLGERYRGRSNVIFCAGGEATPHFVDVERVNAIGSGLKEGCAGRNLVTVHPVSENSNSKFFAASPWLDIYLSQAKSGSKDTSVSFDAAALVLGDFTITPTRPTMMAEHRYEVGTAEDPLLQRRSMYQCVFAGGFGYAYGHNALWQMTPHTAKPWMLKGWKPGVEKWSDALDTPAVQQLHHIKTLLASRPFLTRIPDQSLVLTGQGADVATRIQITRDGTPRKPDATYLMAYLSAPAAIELRTDVIASPTLDVSWFDPATGATEVIARHLPNTGSYRLEKRSADGVLIVDDARKAYAQP